MIWQTTLRSSLTISISVLLGIALNGCDGRGSPSEGARTIPKAMALEEALGQEDPYARARELATLLPALEGEGVPLDIGRILGEYRLELGAVELELLVRYWAGREPAEATDWVFKKASPLHKASLAQTAIEIYAEQDPEGAARAQSKATAEASAEIARATEYALVAGWFKTDRAGLQRYIYDLGAGVKRQRAIYAYTIALATSDGSDAVIRWGESISDDDRRYKLEVYRQLMMALAWADMPAALRFCDAHCDGPYGQRLRNSIIRVWLRTGAYGGDVMEWVATAPGDTEELWDRKRHSIWVAYVTWASSDREAAIDWMAQKIAESPEPDRWLRYLYGEYARQIAADSPEEALRWAAKIEDDFKREHATIRIARFWRTQDEAAAEAWLVQSSLSEEAREKARDTEAPHYIPVAP